MYKIETPNTWKLIKPKNLRADRPFFRREGVDLGGDLVVIEFYTREQLVNYISKFNEHAGTEFINAILDNTGVNDNDMRNVYHWPTSTTPSYTSVEQRRCRILDPYGHNIYNKAFVMEVSNHHYSEEIRAEWWEQHKEKNADTTKNKWSRWSLPDKCYPEFRRGPVPYIHKRRSYCFFRGIRTYNEIKQTTDPEYKEFTRKSRGKNLPTAWDDHVRDWRDDGWKSQGKHKHQWEHGVETRAKHSLGKHHEVIKVTTKKEKWKQLKEWEHWENSDGFGNWNSWDAWRDWDNWDNMDNMDNMDDVA